MQTIYCPRDFVQHAGTAAPRGQYPAQYCNTARLRTTRKTSQPNTTEPRELDSRPPRRTRVHTKNAPRNDVEHEASVRNVAKKWHIAAHVQRCRRSPRPTNRYLETQRGIKYASERATRFSQVTLTPYSIFIATVLYAKRLGRVGSGY